LRIRHLRLLELIHATGSLTAAARQLNISQPNATKLLQELEAAFGKPLVDRNVRGGTLSRAGLNAVERIKIATGSLAALSTALAEDAEMPLVRLGILPLAGVTMMPRLVGKLEEEGKLPRMRIRSGSVSAVLQMLRDGEIDCAIGRVQTPAGETRDDEFDFAPLTDEHFEICCGPKCELDPRRKYGLAELKNHPWILLNPATYTRQIFDSAFVNLGLQPPNAQVESPSFHVSLAMAAETRMLAFVPRSAADYYGALGNVRRLKLRSPFQSDFVVFITRKGAPRHPAINLLEETLKQLAG
jgi:molybdate transport repressor ModE-like protein